ncbi:survival motor neuron protein isoform X2 [Halyomorpha halys]|uniref:survival motor neuron protein isoform X2 n=1 Tax=Halyomorpha halys TaxID=286706 RepID=UPI0006D4CAEE|nr:survival motor neuron protein isoform X2 [Halyomorpha halys]
MRKQKSVQTDIVPGVLYQKDWALYVKMTSNIKHYLGYYKEPYYSDDESVISSLTEEEPESMEDDVWDDTLLIKAYDRAVMLTKERIASRNTAEKEDGTSFPKPITKLNANSNEQEEQCPKKNVSKKEKIKWKVGACCRTVFSEDGLEYEAVIKNIDLDNGVCTVKYLGYNNEEDVDIKSLKPSKGKESQLNQKAQARLVGGAGSGGSAQYQNGYREDYSSYQQNVGMIPPPPPPFVLANLPKDETDALSAMLMAWYMSGFHTGYYQGLTKARMTSQSFGCHNTH